ncbi:MAG: hypothetical protein K2J67_07140, partial [Lachnospiraceae bacterium]|nr:hypothetical protein [Lachnospiraceae bacterium]
AGRAARPSAPRVRGRCLDPAGGSRQWTGTGGKAGRTGSSVCCTRGCLCIPDHIWQRKAAECIVE